MARITTHKRAKPATGAVSGGAVYPTNRQSTAE